MSEAPATADPVVACDAAIDHFTRLANDLNDDYVKHQRQADQARQASQKAKADVLIWRNAKAAILHDEHFQPQPPVQSGTDEEQEQEPDELTTGPPTSVRIAWNAYRDYMELSTGLEYEPHTFNELPTMKRAAWRVAIAAALAQHAKDQPSEPAQEENAVDTSRITTLRGILLTDTADLPRSLFETYMTKTSLSRQVSPQSWDAQYPNVRDAWGAVLLMAQTLLINNGWKEPRKYNQRFELIRAGKYTIGVPKDFGEGCALMVFDRLDSWHSIINKDGRLHVEERSS